MLNEAGSNAGRQAFDPLSPRTVAATRDVAEINGMESANYDPRYVEGVNFFNDCEYFEAHEIWEDLWTEYQGPSRRFYQGLIQVAVCLHHFGNGNTRGAKKLYFSCNKYLQEYPEQFEGIDLAKLRAELQTCCARLLASDEEYPPLEIDPELIPEIHLEPPPVSIPMTDDQ